MTTSARAKMVDPGDAAALPPPYGGCMTDDEGGGTMERIETVIIGGGQAGLAAGYHLKKRGRPFVILEAGERVGDSWRTRWDSLRLFTPAKYDGLPGLRFPAPRWSFPTKDEMADYLEAYAARFELPVRTGVYVDRVYREGGGYVVESGLTTWEAENVIVASGAHRTPKAPEFAHELDRAISQRHSADYRNPGQLREGGVLVVGVGNSGAEIAHELARTHRVWQAGAPAGEIPVPLGSFRGRVVLPVLRFLGTHVLTRSTPLGRKVGPKLVAMATPLLRIKSEHLAAAGVTSVPRVAGVRDGLPLLDDGRVLEVENVVWCTGFRQELSWIDVPAFGADGQPLHERGVVPSAPGLYFVGLVFQHAVTSDVLPGVGRDAAYVAAHLAKAARAGRRATAPRAEQALELT
jgi:putative flavoprotein involved in K+ transport